MIVPLILQGGFNNYIMEDFKYYNLREFTLDLTELLNEVEDLREENASLKKQVADYNDFITNLNKRNQEFAVETIKQLINDIR